MYLFGIYFVTIIGFTCGVYYEAFTGTTIGVEDLKKYDKANNTFWCVTEIKPCDPNEGRRLDGSCNNLDKPSRGAAHTPIRRLLPSEFSEEDGYFEPKKSKSGNELPLVRYLRTHTLIGGRIPSQHFTHLLTHFAVFMAGDFTSVHDTVNYIRWTTHCCTPKGKTDRTCAPIEVPDDDPVFRFSDIRCLNLTRPLSFQSMGCIKNDTSPRRIVTATPGLDLGHLYGSNPKVLRSKRQLERGLLKVEELDGSMWPPATNKPSICLLNQRPQETRCHDMPEDGANSILGINLFSIWFWRYHNVIASKLAELNPCWSDDKLFDTARDINIAVYLQIVYYELLPLLMGKYNLLRDKVISYSPGFRDLYDPNKAPRMTMEASYMWRYLHAMQEGIVKMYDSDGNYIKEMQIVDLTLRTGYLALGKNLAYLTQGGFRQPTGRTDHVVDYDLVGKGFGPLQRANDILSSDLAKNRLFGIPSYVKYREYCSGRTYDRFESLVYDMEPERIDMMEDLYEHVEDIDLMVGVWSEKFKRGGYVPKTFYCLVADQMLWNIESDRFWYERPNRPNAYTLEQLQEIRKMTVSRFLCDVGDTVTRIQPHGFLRAGFGNQIGDCRRLPQINFAAWKDPTCGKKE